MGGGIVELSIMVLLVEVPFDCVGHSQEVVHVDGVADVGVQVVLEVLEHVHVLVHEVISSYSWEGEGLVVQLPGMNLQFWVLAVLFIHGFGDGQDVGPVSWVEGSGEHVNLVVEFFLVLIQVLAWLVELDK